ncbi:hypothetical protein HYY72_02005 [Candidatus Woesearchaeota archaeon]|nr:hypothetical protein [Candidatus Woesearchaeota archaeon]
MNKGIPSLKDRLKPYYFRAFAAALIILAAVFLFGQGLKFIAFVAVLFIAASFSTFYHNFFRSPVNFELVKFATILCSVSYGAPAGISVGVMSTIASKVISEKLDHTAIVSLVGIIVIAAAAAAFRETDIVVLGMVLVAGYHLMTAPVQMALGGTLSYGVVYVGTNILFNLILFTRIAPFLVKIM